MVRIGGEHYRVREARVNDQLEQQIYIKGHGKNKEVFVMNENGELVAATQQDVTLYTGYRKPKNVKNNYTTQNYRDQKAAKEQAAREQELASRMDGSYYTGENADAATLGPRANGEPWKFDEQLTRWKAGLDNLVGRVGDFMGDDGKTHKAQVKYDFETGEHYLELVTMSDIHDDIRVTRRVETNEKGEIITDCFDHPRQYQIKNGDKWEDQDRNVMLALVKARNTNLANVDKPKPEQGI